MRGKRGFGASRSVEQTLIRDTRKPVFNLGQIAAILGEIFHRVEAVSPQNDTQRRLRSQALQIGFIVTDDAWA